MGNYKQGDVLWRHGTVGARREPSSHAVVVLAVNNEERLNGERFYTCALISNKPMGKSGEVPIQDSEGSVAFVNLSQIMIVGDRSLRTLNGGTEPKIGELSPAETARVKSSLDALVAVEKSHFGKVVYSVTPSHDGVRGKPNRPYVLIGGMGKGTDVFFAVPVSSSPGQAGNGTAIKDLDSAGLVRDEGEASHLRLAWSGTINTKTSSQPAGRLSETDGKNLYQQFVSFKKQLISGTVGAELREESPAKEIRPTADIRATAGSPGREGVFPAGLSRGGAVSCSSAIKPAGIGRSD